MDPNTGRIQAIYTEEDEQDARDNGLIPLTAEQAAEVGPMNRKQRRAWAKKNLTRAQRKELR